MSAERLRFWSSVATDLVRAFRRLWKTRGA